jgi:hypothetical protein
VLDDGRETSPGPKLEGSYRSAILWGVFLGPIALLWLVGILVTGTVRWLGRRLQSIEYQVKEFHRAQSRDRGLIPKPLS